ncbi:MAG TPA: glycosyltransferase family 9 protein, partial [Candidatus Deferrimicrobiaceae bacterium]
SFPRAHICVVTARELSDLVEANPHLDEKVYVPGNLFRGDLRGFLRFAREVRALRPDVFVDLRSNVKSFLLRNLSGARTVLAYRKQRKAGPGERRLHAAENLLRTVFPLTGIVSELEYPIWLREEDILFADAYLDSRVDREGGNRRIVVLNPTVGWAIPSRLWPPEYFARLGGRIGKELRAAVVLTGGPSDREYCGTIAEGMDPRPVLAAGELTLGQAAALIRRADLLVSGDTGPLHVAAAVGTRVIGLYGSVNTERSRPIGKGHVVLKKEMWCLPCEEKVCPLGTTQCMRDITPEEVFAEVRKALSEPLPRAERTGG